MSSFKLPNIIRASQGRKMSSAQVTNYDLSMAIASALQRAVGHFKKPAAIISERIGRSIGAAKKWLAGENAPGAAELIELAREYDEVWDAICMLAHRSPVDLTEAQLRAAEEALRLIVRRS